MNEKVSWENDVITKSSRTGRNCVECDGNCCAACFDVDGGPLFKTLSKQELESMVDFKQSVHFKPGQTILKQNTISSHIICLRKGLVKVYVEGSKDKNLILKLIKDIGMITSGGILSKNVRPFTVSAVTEVECCFINSDKILQLFTSNNKFAIALLDQHNHQSNQMFNTLINLTQKYMPGRVADTLLTLKNEVYRTNPFQVPLSRQELADMSAMTKESFVRILKEFKTSNLVKLEGKTFEIVDEQSLMELSKNG